MEGPVTNIHDLIAASVHRSVLGGRPQNAKRVDDSSSMINRLRLHNLVGVQSFQLPTIPQHRHSSMIAMSIVWQVCALVLCFLAVSQGKLVSRFAPHSGIDAPLRHFFQRISPSPWIPCTAFLASPLVRSRQTTAIRVGSNDDTLVRGILPWSRPTLQVLPFQTSRLTRQIL